MAQGRDPAPGDVLAGRWTIERVIGRGGMGVVVAAFDARTRARVALKLMHAHDRGNAVAVERFFREARAAARLVSPFVARVTEAERLEDGRPYMAMDLLEGSDLARVLDARGPLPVAEAARYLHQAASGCVVAHAAGVIHRDLKPANLFLADVGQGARAIKLLDFGISKLSGLSGTVGHQLTADGDITGSPLYMSPEQLRVRDVDARADVWGLGATLYELLTGRRPFQAENMMAECNRILTEAPVPPSRVRADVPPALDVVVLRCLEKDARQRYASASELAAALAPFAAMTTPRRGRARVAVTLLIVAALAAVGLYALRFRRAIEGSEPPPAATASAGDDDGVAR